MFTIIVLKVITGIALCFVTRLLFYLIPVSIVWDGDSFGENRWSTRLIYFMYTVIMAVYIWWVFDLHGKTFTITISL